MKIFQPVEKLDIKLVSKEISNVIITAAYVKNKGKRDQSNIIRYEHPSKETSFGRRAKPFFMLPTL